MKLKFWIIVLQLLGGVFAGLAAEKAGTVAVLDFSVPDTESNRWSWAQNGLADLLQTELQQQDLVLLDRDMIHAVLSEQRMAASGMMADGYPALGKLLNAQYLISGKLTPLAGSRFQIEAEAFSVEAVETRVTAKAIGEFPKDLDSALRAVARQIANGISTGKKGKEQTPPTARAPKPESLIMFYRGLNACADGQPEQGAAYFMNAASLDPNFTVPLLWEIKAYEMAGLTHHADIRRAELADILQPLGLAAGATNASEAASQPVIAVLNPLVNGDGAGDAASLAGDLRRALLAEKQVRVFAYEGIGAAVAEQDLRLSSFFADQNAPRYGRWLTADGLLLCRVNQAEHGNVSVELALVNPLNASVMDRVQRTMPTDALPRQLPKILKELMAGWLNRAKPSPVSPANHEASALQTENPTPDLRPIYQNLVTALWQLRREPGKSDSHRSLADAFAATGRPHLAAYEIEQCLKLLDIHAPDADTTYLGTHRWLFWQPSPASGAVGLVDRRLIDHMIEQLLTNYPASLAAGCMRYNLAVTAWRGKNWPETITQARQSRAVLQAVTAQYDLQAKGVNNGDLEFEMIAATYFLEGASLRESGDREAAAKVFHQGLDFMKSFSVRDFCLPYGPYIGTTFGPQRVYGYGGDSPGIRTRLEQQLAGMGDFVKPAPTATVENTGANEPEIETNSSAYWIQQGDAEMQSHDYRKALNCYQKAVAGGAAVSQCTGLADALLEIALEANPDHPQAEIERLRRQLDFPPVQASWVEWFGTGRKYQRRHEFEKAAACYRGALDFLEHPEKGGIYHLEKDPQSNRINLRWGPTLGETDLLWSEHYAARWYSAAFYLAQCLIKLDQKEEAAQWLRQVAIKVGGDSALPLLNQDAWRSSTWSSGNIGPRAAEMLQQLHDQPDTPKGLEFGEADGAFKIPPPVWDTRPLTPPPLPPIKPEMMFALTNALTKAASETNVQTRTACLQALVKTYGHEIVPATLSLLLQPGDRWDEGALISILEPTATNSDAPWVASACVRRLKLIKLALRLDPEATATDLAAEWRQEEESGFVSFWLKNAILDAHVRPLYALVLQEIADAEPNHHTDVFNMDRVVKRENSPELEAAFCEALSACLKTKLQKPDNYELYRISKIALRHGVPEAVDGLLACEGDSPEKLRADLGPVLDLPGSNDEIVPFLNANRGHWKWNAGLKKFQQTAVGPAMSAGLR